jgi:superfamily II DNA or RNA helicase
MEYGHARAVADGVNVDYLVYKIQTQITAQGSTIEKGYYVDKRDRRTRAIRWEQANDNISYSNNQLDRDVVAKDQLRTVLRTFKDTVCSEIFPGRAEVPKTLIFAKDDSHADDILEILLDVFNERNAFAQKITYKTTGRKPEELISEFRNNYYPRVAVTVDMISTGTDIKPLEILLFMRAVKSANFFEQMKGRGTRVIDDEEFSQVTPNVPGGKTHFVLVDAVGVLEALEGWPPGKLEHLKHLKHRQQTPEKWRADLEQARAELRNLAPGESRSNIFKKYSYLWSDVKECYRHISHEKCWYCEAKTDRIRGDIDHYRPKGRVTENPAHPGYWWLAFDWRNWRFCCELCNSKLADYTTGEIGGKGNDFPLVDDNESRRIWQECEFEDLLAEDPKLLDPTDPQDPDLLTFTKDGLPGPITSHCISPKRLGHPS